MNSFRCEIMILCTLELVQNQYFVPEQSFFCFVYYSTKVTEVCDSLRRWISKQDPASPKFDVNKKQSKLGHARNFITPKCPLIFLIMIPWHQLLVSKQVICNWRVETWKRALFQNFGKKNLGMAAMPIPLLFGYFIHFWINVRWNWFKFHLTLLSYSLQHRT